MDMPCLFVEDGAMGTLMTMMLKGAFGDRRNDVAYSGSDEVGVAADEDCAEGCVLAEVLVGRIEGIVGAGADEVKEGLPVNCVAETPQLLVALLAQTYLCMICTLHLLLVGSRLAEF